ncbi:protein immune deficiency [Phymastichus coffea]|uniref:protein immune deficiency n=1 Tax=Phymastichus coffea TaxID=108790 RepID=UPI00273AE32A|nr:protein immune deficiency [Phymastichus coffea]
MSTDIDTLVCDAIADPPRISEETTLKEQMRIQEQQNQKIPSNPEIGNVSNKHRHQRLNHENSSASDDRDSNHDKEQEKKPRRKSRKNSSSSNNRGMTINNVVSGSTNVSINFSNQTLINVNANSTSASKKEQDRNKETDKANKEMPQYIKSLIECQSIITTLDKLTTKQYIGDNWKKVAKNLDLKKSEVEQCFIDHSKEGIGEVMFQVLTIWNHRYGKLATLGALLKALWTAEEYVCAKELAVIHKSE